MAIMSDHALGNAGDLLSEERKKGPRYQRWTRREETIVEVQALMDKTVSEIAERLGREGFHRSYKSIATLLGKLGLTAKGGSKGSKQTVVPFSSK